MKTIALDAPWSLEWIMVQKALRANENYRSIRARCIAPRSNDSNLCTLGVIEVNPDGQFDKLINIMVEDHQIVTDGIGNFLIEYGGIVGASRLVVAQFSGLNMTKIITAAQLRAFTGGPIMPPGIIVDFTYN